MLNQKEKTGERYVIPQGQFVFLDGNDSIRWITKSKVYCEKRGKHNGKYSVYPTSPLQVENRATKRQRTVRSGERVRIPFRSLVKA